MNSPVSFLTNLRQDRLQRCEMSFWNKIINALKSSRGNIPAISYFYFLLFIKFIYTHEFTCQFFDQSKTRSFTALRNVFLKQNYQRAEE